MGSGDGGVGSVLRGAVLVRRQVHVGGASGEGEGVHTVHSKKIDNILLFIINF